jgi:hypothetical protein
VPTLSNWIGTRRKMAGIRTKYETRFFESIKKKNAINNTKLDRVIDPPIAAILA